MEPFNFVIFGFTGNLSQLKIIPALYNLETNNLLPSDTKIIGIGRKEIDLENYITNIVKKEDDMVKKLVGRTIYLNSGYYSYLQKLEGNTIYYLATYPDLYAEIFESLKKYGLNSRKSFWTKIMIEKPIGSNLLSSIELNSHLSNYFGEENVYRVDHYLGKGDLRDLFNMSFTPTDVDNIQISILEEGGIGKRGVYYDATGALIDVGQNHLLQLLVAVCKEENTVMAREDVLKNILVDSNSLVLGQYGGYLDEENIRNNSQTDTFFSFSAHLNSGPWKEIPIYLRGGKKMQKSEIKISIVYKRKKSKSWIIGSGEPYEKLIMESVVGNKLFFNSEKEVEYSWNVVDRLNSKKTKPIIYAQESLGPSDGTIWI